MERTLLVSGGRVPVSNEGSGGFGGILKSASWSELLSECNGTIHISLGVLVAI